MFAGTTRDGNEDAASIDAEAERTCITMKYASRLTDQAQVPNPFKAKWFGSPSDSRVRVIEPPVGGMSTSALIEHRGRQRLLRPLVAEAEWASRLVSAMRVLSS